MSSIRTRGASIALPVLLMVLAGGCGRIEALATVGERPATVASAPGCRTPDSASRAWHYRAQLDLGESPPSSARAGSKSAVRRTIRTTHIEPAFELRDGLVFVLGFFWCVLAILLLVGVSRAANKKLKAALVLGGVSAVLGVGMLVVGYLAGSVISLDNPTDYPVQITIEGRSVEVPARSFTEIRVLGPSAEIRTESAGQLVEEVSFEVDDHPLQTLFRALLGDGRYVYTVCGGNTFSEGQFNYG